VVSETDVHAGWARYARAVSVPVCLMGIILVLREIGMAGTAPLRVFAVLVLAGTALHLPEVQLALAGGDLTQRLWPRAAMRFVVNTSLIYALGWGPALAAGHFVLVADFLAQSGSRAWRPAAACSVGSLALGEVAVALGLFSYLPQPQVHGVAALIALLTVVSCRIFGNAVRKQEEAENALRVSEARFRAVVQDGSDIITLTDADGRIVYVSPTAERITGHPPESLLGVGLWTHIHPDDTRSAVELNQRIHGSPGTEHTGEIRIRHADGSFRWHEFVVRNLLAHPGVQAIVGHHRDVDGRRNAQDRIAFAATHDALTGLVNNAAFKLALEQSLADGARGGYPVALLFLDLDGFKQVNDVHGHAAGDEMLRMVSDVLRRVCRERDVVGRIGGDEFVVLCNGVGGVGHAEAVARAVVTGIDDAQPPDDGQPRVGCSIGIALAEPGAVDARTLLRRADAAMYASKRRGRNGYEVFADSMTADAP